MNDGIQEIDLSGYIEDLEAFSSEYLEDLETFTRGYLEDLEAFLG